MHKTTILVAAVAIILLYALYLGKDVKLSFRLPGTAAALEVVDQRSDERDASDIGDEHGHPPSMNELDTP